jgi:hypothetical protein
MILKKLKNYLRNKFLKVIILIKKILKIFRQIILSSQEKNFIKNNNKIINIKKIKKKTFLIQGFWNYYILLLFKYLLLKKNIHERYEIVAIWPINIYPYKYNENIFYNKLRNFYYFLIQKKWSKLYKSIGAKYFYNLEPDNFKIKNRNYKIATKILKKIKTKKDVLDLKFKNIPVGDLVYDTFLRLGREATLELNHPFLLECIYKTLNALSAISEVDKKHNINVFYSTYSVYIQHGIPVRYLLNKSKSLVFSFGNPLFTSIKKLSKQDSIHTVAYQKFKKNFENLENKKIRIKFAKDELEKKFSGGNDFSTRNNFLPINTYKSKKKIAKIDLSKIDGVLFLHDFFDSPHLWGDLLYPDLYEWAIDTLLEIKKNNLRIAIKSHPNSRIESLKINLKLENMFNDLIWIDKDLSNTFIFKQNNIKFGISCYGTILYEMAYHNKIVISAGSNPTSSFDIAFTPKNINEYKYFLNNAGKLKIKKKQKEEVQKLYYMYFLHDYFYSNDSDLNFVNKINLIKLLYDDMGKIKNFDKKINKKILSDK